MKQTYIVLAPVTSKGKFKVCASRIGEKPHTAYYEVAECPNQTQADLVQRALTVTGEQVPELEHKVRAA